MHLTTPLLKLVRTTEEQKKALTRLGITTVRDVLYHFPVRYSSLTNTRLVNDLEHNETVTLYGRISNLQAKKSWTTKRPMGSGKLTDINGDSISVMWFNQPYIAKMLKENQSVKLTGTISKNARGLTLTNPEIEQAPDMPIDAHTSLFNTESGEEHFGYPVYPETRGLSSKWVYHTVQKVMTQELLSNLVDPIPEFILKKYNLPSIATALVWIHMPKKQSDADAARKRFAFEEIFLIQLKKQQSRCEYEALYTHTIGIDQQQLGDFIARFPFTLTDAQQSTIDTIVTDLESPRPMSRLLEGDVGSGKTAIAASITHGIVTNQPKGQSYGNLQVAYMAPTEVLATQLFENFVGYFEHTGVQVALITGSGCRKFPSKVGHQKWTDISATQLKKWIKNGEIPIVIGTHALISKSLEFKHLALVIVDEQHRFGTKQRMELAKKAGSSPHYLSMTATPIPRTLALTIYGDLDLSILDGMPPGRKPVITQVIAPDKRTAVYAEIQKGLDAGRQLYVICPRIVSPNADTPLTESEWQELTPMKRKALQLKSVTSEAKHLQETVFKNHTIGVMHSKMTKEEKEKVMKKFATHELDILVATSVIEVGVNVPNATMIIIEGAERYGLAQLHQLRGRVIRSQDQAYCWLFADIVSDTTKNRLDAFIKAKNGFELAELDLALRGTGDLAGVKQWGISDLAMEAIKNLKMVEAARTEAKVMIQNDPHLENFPELSDIIRSEKFEMHFE